MNSLYCVILAGGTGSRLWPLSQASLPKQFLDLIGAGRTMLQLTFDRFRRICDADHFVVVTLDEYRNTVMEQLPEIPIQNILCEPFRRNTAASIAFANAYIKQITPESVAVVTPADHIILNEEVFCDTVYDCAEFVSANESLMTIGIKATRPETAFGYIQVGDSKGKSGKTEIRQTRTFTEKPNAEMAQVFLDCGDFCWNSGVFVWQISVVEEAIRKFMPTLQGLFDPLDTIPYSHWDQGPIRTVYEQCESISIDYAIMEKASNVVVCLSDARWSDLGGWNALYDNSSHDEYGNAVVAGQAILRNSSNCFIHADKGTRWIVEGLNDYLVVQCDDTVLICPRLSGATAWKYASEIRIDKR